jgi:hypothetical protein
MKKIIDFSTKDEAKFTKEDLSILIHGKEHSGASLLSITLAVGLHEADNKLCIFTAYPMAKEEFLKQVKNPEKVFYLENEEDFEKALEFQTVIVQSGNIDLFIKAISNHSFVNDRIIFIKNIETIKIPIFKFVSPYPFIVSGDLELNPAQKDFKNFTYNTKILFSPIEGEKISFLEKYQASMKNRLGDGVITVK